MRTGAGRTPPPDLDVTGLTDQYKYSIVCAPHIVENEDAKLLRSLLNVFGQAESVEELIDAADGSGLKLLKDLREHSCGRTAARSSAIFTPNPWLEMVTTLAYGTDDTAAPAAR